MIERKNAPERLDTIRLNPTILLDACAYQYPVAMTLETY
jgi:hypothetical protein